MSFEPSKLFGKDDETGSSNPDPTMKKPPGKPSGENVPPAGGESMAPTDSRHPYAPPGGLESGKGRGSGLTQAAQADDRERGDDE